MNADLMNFRLEWVGADIDDVDSVGAESREDEFVSRLPFVPEAAGASVPTSVMKLVAHERHVQNVDNCVGR